MRLVDGQNTQKTEEKKKHNNSTDFLLFLYKSNRERGKKYQKEKLREKIRLYNGGRNIK